MDLVDVELVVDHRGLESPCFAILHAKEVGHLRRRLGYRI